MGDGILNVKRWEPFEYVVPGGGAVKMELRRFNALEAAPYLRTIALGRRAFLAEMKDDRSLPELPEDAPLEQLEQHNREVMARIANSVAARGLFFAAIPDDMIRSVFSKHVRNIELVVDGEAVTDGQALLEVADHDMLLSIIQGLERMCTLTPLQGKASASPSTSGAGQAASGAPDVTPTASEASPIASTVTETIEPGSSIGPSE